MTQTDYDIVIVGAGIAGSTLACALGDSRYRVVLFDRAGMPDWPGDRVSGTDQTPTYDARVSAINIGSARILTAIGAWQAILERRHKPFHAMHIWDESGQGATHFDATTLGETCFGTITENRMIARALLESATNLDNVTLQLDSTLTAIKAESDHVQVTLADGDSVSARLIVGADGGRSYVRHTAGIEMPFKNYHQRTLVGTVATEHDHQDTAWQRFLSTGPCAYLPLAPHLCSLAWHADAELADALLEMDEPAFNAELATATDDCLGKPRMVSERSAFPLFRGHAEHYIDDRLALIGDAAHVIHPLAGLGANLGIMDAASLAQSLIEHGTEDPGRQRALRAYERWRRPENAAVVAVTDSFYEVFGSRGSSVRRLRNLGLRVANRAGPAKQEVMRLAAGVAGDLPALALA